MTTAAPFYGQADDDQLGPLPPARPPVVELPAPRDHQAADPRRPAPHARPAAPRATRTPREGVRPDVLALLLALAVVVAVTVLALKGVDVPDVLATIGLVAVGVGAGTAIPTGRRGTQP